MTRESNPPPASQQACPDTPSPQLVGEEVTLTYAPRVEPHLGIEPRTSSVPRKCSSTEPTRRCVTVRSSRRMGRATSTRVAYNRFLVRWVVPKDLSEVPLVYAPRLEPPVRIERTTCALQERCSATEPRRRWNRMRSRRRRIRVGPHPSRESNPDPLINSQK